MFTSSVIILSIIILAGLALALLGWRQRRVVDPLNPVPSSPKILIIGLVLIVIGVAGIGTVFLKQGKFFPPTGEKPPGVKRPEQFSVIATSPQNGATVPRNAVAQVFLNRAVRPTDAIRLRVLAVEKDGSTKSIPSSLNVMNDPMESQNPNSGIMVMRPLFSCEGKEKDQPCFEANTKYKVELDAGNIRDLKDTETLSCSSARPCSFEFTTNDKIDIKPPEVSLPINLNLPVSDNAPVNFKVSDDNGLAYVRLTMDKHQSAPRSLGIFTGPFDEKEPLIIDTRGYAIPSRHFFTVEAYDAFGHRTEATSVVAFYESHCFNNKQDVGETEVDCGGRDCIPCQKKEERKNNH